MIVFDISTGEIRRLNEDGGFVYRVEEIEWRGCRVLTVERLKGCGGLIFRRPWRWIVLVLFLCLEWRLKRSLYQSLMNSKTFRRYNQQSSLSICFRASEPLHIFSGELLRASFTNFITDWKPLGAISKFFHWWKLVFTESRLKTSRESWIGFSDFLTLWHFPISSHIPLL